MLKKALLVLTVAALAATPLAGPATAGGGRDVGREILGPNDGWGSAEGGVTGGSAATRENVFVVRNRNELAAAVAGTQPKIVIVAGRFNANVDENGQPLGCADYAADGYDFDAYVRTYDPAVWTGAPTGPLETARLASNANQGKRVKITVGSNTTLIGRPGAAITGAQIDIESAENVIVRHLTLRDAYTCFPGWNGDAWKTEWDNLVVSRSRHVWIDHVTINDGDSPDAAEPIVFGQHLLRHDGLLDIVRGSDLVTVSWSRFTGHDKSLLWGNGDTATGDIGKLRITMHHSELTNLVQRGPRVRFGQVHVYNNLYRSTADSGFLYSWGVGVQSKLYAENNAFRLDRTFPASQIITAFGGTAIHATGTLLNGRPVDALAEYNAVHDPDLSSDVGWTPTLHTRIDPTWRVPALVQANAGAR
ncbi:pectate lyase family protein [Paractinoplanes rishiriensis]|uniref:Pectate lyase n=1 Tax=Paractinoplanes rishiriensis TaxID=1050105 RepID=A0A919MUT7_9ACTN|nr:pectate lyase [Actinoplanes rishiriensis]GIE95694.1 pectate lyase [Actinoplanes rishiriensis]